MNNSRAIIVIMGFIGFFAVLFLKLFEIQITKHEDFDYYAKNQQIEKKIIRAERGFILDRNGELLAYDRQYVSFYADMRMLKKKQKSKVAEAFAQVFNKKPSYYIKLMNFSRRTVCLEKKAPKDVAAKLLNLVVDGLFSREDPSRVYSYDNLASHILGYVAGGYEGVQGIEKFYNKELTGQNGQMVVERDVRGRVVTVLEDATVPSVPGYNVELTIDRNYQKILEEELSAGLEKFKGKSATGIIINPRNGEILAMANAPDFNPNAYWEYDDFHRRNRALTDTYEPGSTFKSLTLSILLNENLCNESERVYAENGSFKYKKIRIADSHRSQWLSVRGVIEQSSNIGMVKLIGRVGEEDFYKYLRNYGFGNYSFIDLPGESRGRLKKPDSFNELTKAFMSYGYEISITPIQLAAAYAALLNGGNLYQPHLLKRISTRKGEVVQNYENKLLRNVVSAETSKRLRDMLVGVVENGTAKAAKIEGVRIGGKTGTSQLLINKSYSSSKYNSSFVGFFPADNPSVVCLILVNSPEVGGYGGIVAAPIFKNVAQRLINQDNSLIQATSTKENLLEKVLASDNHGAASKGHNSSYANLPEGQANSGRAAISRHIMPDLTNRQIRDAIALLSEIGLKYKVVGNGKVVSQSIKAGSAIRPGLLCQLKCEAARLSGLKIN